MTDTERKPPARFVNELRRWELGELQMAASAITELEAHPGWGWLQRLVQGREEALVDQLVESDVVLEQAQYAQIVGKLSGLRALAQAAEAIRYTAGSEEERLVEEHERRRRLAQEEEGT